MREEAKFKCIDCEATFDPRPSGRGPFRIRCTTHRLARKAELQRARAAFRRAKELGVDAELVIASEVFERDNWTCHICGDSVPEPLRRVARTHAAWEPLAPVVDHVIPLSRGGSHTMGNCSTAHADCNSHKSSSAEYLHAPKKAQRKRVFNREAVLARLARDTVAQPVSERGRTLFALSDDCHIWVGTKPNPRGYASAWAGGYSGSVHRLAYDAVHGEDSAQGLSIDHLCGVPLCCNPNHLEAVTVEENLRRAALWITKCRNGHEFDDQNTLQSSQSGHRICRQCNRNRYHLKVHGHDFVLDETTPSGKKRRCLTCRLTKEATPQFCPYGHEYTPENKRVSQGKRVCNQCIRDRTHVPQFGHSFVLDTTNPSSKRERCLVCVESAEPVTHCIRGHQYTSLTLEYSKKGHRRCVQCRLNAVHFPTYGHEFAIDPNHDGKLRRCLICRANQMIPTHCINGHQFTELNTEYHSTRGHRICVQCRLDATHIPKHQHSFLIDPDHNGRLRRCVTCSELKRSERASG